MFTGVYGAFFVKKQNWGHFWEQLMDRVLKSMYYPEDCSGYFFVIYFWLSNILYVSAFGEIGTSIKLSTCISSFGGSSQK